MKKPRAREIVDDYGDVWFVSGEDVMHVDEFMEMASEVAFRIAVAIGSFIRCLDSGKEVVR